MRIGVDISSWFNGRGFGRFTRELVAALVNNDKNHEWVLFTDQPHPEPMTSANVRYVQVAQSVPVTDAAVENSSRRIRDMLAFSRALGRESLDTMFYPAVYSWYPSPMGLPVVLTVHDAIAEHFPQLVFPTLKNRLLWRLKMRLAQAQATRILTVSHAAKAEIVEHMKVAAHRIDVTTEGPSALFVPCRDDAERATLRQQVQARLKLASDAEYFVYVGGFAPHKNLLGLLEAYAQLKADPGTEHIQLVLVGDYAGHGFHSNYQALQQRIAGSNDLSGSVHFTGYISDEELAQIYATSLAMVFPSLSEGFGLPAVESMAAGTPVLASNCASLPEVVGDAGMLFDPRDTASIAKVLRRFVGDKSLQRQLRVRALERSREFTWDVAARLTMKSIERSVKS